MQLNWKDYLMLHAPHIAMLAFGVIGLIYTLGFERGKHLILEAASNAVVEARRKTL